MSSKTFLELTKSGQPLAQKRNSVAELQNLERKDENGNYRYLTPKNLSATSARFYEESIDRIFSGYSSVLRELVGYIRKTSEKPESVSKATWKSTTTSQAVEVASALLPMASTIENKSISNGKQPTQESQLTTLVERIMPQTMSPASDEIELIKYSPLNELELVEDILFELSSQPANIAEDVYEEMTFEKKIELFRRYCTAGGRASLRQARYEWEIVESIATAQNILSLSPSADVVFQEFSPRLGYEVPLIVEEAKVSEIYERCFDASYELYSSLQAAGYYQEAELAILRGHRLRWRLRIDANSLSKILNNGPKGGEHGNSTNLYGTLTLRWQDIHPTIASILSAKEPGRKPTK